VAKLFIGRATIELMLWAEDNDDAEWQVTEILQVGADGADVSIVASEATYCLSEWEDVIPFGTPDPDNENRVCGEIIDEIKAFSDRTRLQFGEPEYVGNGKWQTSFLPTSKSDNNGDN